MFNLAKITLINSDSDIICYPTHITTEDNIVKFTVALPSNNTVEYSVDCSNFLPREGLLIYINPNTNLFETLPWGDKEYKDFITVAYVVNAGETNVICVYELKDITTLTSTLDIVDITNVSSFRNYIYSFPSAKKASQILLAKYKTVYANLDIYNVAAQLETQLDLVTRILLLLIQDNPELKSKYGDYLTNILNVGVETFGDFDVAGLISDKQRVRQLQIEYFKLRSEIEQGKDIPFI